MANEAARKNMLDRAIRAIAEIDQIRADCAHWNRMHPHEPIDADPDGALRRARASAQRVIDDLDTDAADA
jgi:hypothetical protein